jgi:hypothetical protein
MAVGLGVLPVGDGLPGCGSPIDLVTVCIAHEVSPAGKSELIAKTIVSELV